ncbi:MAG: nitrous oxide reductase accessory protein NosL [Paracoccaceae bacterium]
MPDPIPMSRDALSYYCQMNIIDHAGPKGQIHLEGQSTPLFFAQVRDAIAYLKAPEREARITAIYVSDMGNAPNWKNPGVRNWTAARTATFVVGAGVRGGMGAPEIVPFAKPEDADAFIDRYGGTAMTIDEIPDDAVLAPVDLNTPLEEPS